MTETTLSAAITWALEHGWLEEQIPFAVADRYFLTLPEEQVDTVIAVAQARLALEFPTAPTEGV